MKLLHFSLILILLLEGCVLSKEKVYNPAPSKLAPINGAGEEIHKIGVIPLTTQLLDTKLSLHDKLYLESMGEYAGEGAVQGLSGLDEPATIVLAPVLATLGGVTGATIGVLNPKQVPANPTHQQSLTANAIFTTYIKSITSNEHILQNSLVELGNRLTSHSFSPINGLEPIRSNQIENHIKTTIPTDAYLRPTYLLIQFVGEQSSDPDLKLFVKISYSLSKSTYPDTCFGWYSATWTGFSNRLSLWSENNGDLFKQELRKALRALSYQAISYLFDSNNIRMSQYMTYDTYPDWLQCYEARNQNINNHADWYCPSADNGIASSQLRIGDLYYQSGIGDSLTKAFVWYSLAAYGNNAEANMRLNKVLQEITPPQLVDAKELLEKWKPGSCKSDLLTLID